MKKKILITVLIALLILCVLHMSGLMHKEEPKPLVPLSEITDAALDPEIESILTTMTTEQKIGQMFMGCFYNGTPSAKTVAKYNLGNVLLFGASFNDTDKKELTSSLAAIHNSLEIPPIIAVDEEGGTVNRVSLNTDFRKKPFASPRKLYSKGGMNAVISQTHEKNKLLLSLGIDMNLAPVCDISTDPDDFMYSRSLGQNAQTTSLFVQQTVTACIEDGIACSLKHFPGYGSAVDTHTGIAVDSRPLPELQSNDLLPFKAGIDAGAHSVLVSHNIVTSIDENLPASLSPAAHRLLREDLGFDGVIITDDLSMGAIRKFLSNTNSAVAAVMAGNDILCTNNIKVQYNAVLNAVRNGQISEERIDQSVRRILRLKIELGLITTS